MNRPSTTLTLALLASSLAIVAGTARAGVTYSVTIDTSSLAPGTQGYLDFQFNAGGSDAQSASAIAGNFQATGMSFGAATTYGAASGPAAFPNGPITFANTFADNEAIQSVSFATGSNISFDVTLEGPAVDAPDGLSTAGTSFTFGILDLSFNPLLPASGPVDPLFEVDITPLTGAVVALNDAPTVVNLVASVPEPSSIGLIGIGLALTTLVFNGLAMRSARTRRGCLRSCPETGQ
jgi:hypothetical protein